MIVALAIIASITAITVAALIFTAPLRQPQKTPVLGEGNRRAVLLETRKHWVKVWRESGGAIEQNALQRMVEIDLEIVRLEDEELRRVAR